MSWNFVKFVLDERTVSKVRFVYDEEELKAELGEDAVPTFLGGSNGEENLIFARDFSFEDVNIEEFY